MFSNTWPFVYLLALWTSWQVLNYVSPSWKNREFEKNRENRYSSLWSLRQAIFTWGTRQSLNSHYTNTGKLYTLKELFFILALKATHLYSILYNQKHGVLHDYLKLHNPFGFFSVIQNIFTYFSWEYFDSSYLLTERSLSCTKMVQKSKSCPEMAKFHKVGAELSECQGFSWTEDGAVVVRVVYQVYRTPTQARAQLWQYAWPGFLRCRSYRVRLQTRNGTQWICVCMYVCYSVARELFLWKHQMKGLMIIDCTIYDAGKQLLYIKSCTVLCTNYFLAESTDQSPTL